MMESKISLYWERFAIYIMGILIAICGWLFVDQKSQMSALDNKIQVLQVEKVSRQELKDMEDRMYSRMDNMRGDILDRFDRLDYQLTGRPYRSYQETNKPRNK